MSVYESLDPKVNRWISSIYLNVFAYENLYMFPFLLFLHAILYVTISVNV